MAVHFSSKSYEWPTPQWLYDQLNAEFSFTLDPCATPENAKCQTFFTASDDGLKQDWSGHTVFMNPPYGRQIGRWVQKAHESALNGSTVVCLLPSRTDTRWWHDYVLKHTVRFLKGRLCFGDKEGCAPFPSAIVIMKPA